MTRESNIMEECYTNEMYDQVRKINMQLKEKFEAMLEIRVKYAKLQLDFAKLHRPECLQMLKELQEIVDFEDSMESGGKSNT